MVATKETYKEESDTLRKHLESFGMMTRIWKSKELTMIIKINEAMIQPIFAVRIGICWTMRKQDEKSIFTAEMS